MKLPTIKIPKIKTPATLGNLESKLENKIDEILRDERVLNLMSKNINNMIRMQNFATRRLELVLRIADVPTLKGLNELFESVNHLEKETMKQRERILFLEKKLASLENVNPINLDNVSDENEKIAQTKKAVRKSPKSMSNEV